MALFLLKLLWPTGQKLSEFVEDIGNISDILAKT